MAMKRKNLLAVVPELFEHEEFGQFRFIKRGEEILFVGKDVAIALGYKEPEKAVREHVPDKFKGVSVLDTPGGKQKVVIISEAGLYRLAFSSKLPSAVKFTDWVCEEVLPSIRKYGYYIAPNQKVISIKGAANFKKFKAQYPEGAVEVKNILLGANEPGEYRDYLKYEVVLRSDKLIGGEQGRTLPAS